MAINQNKNVIKRVYDEYKPGDYQYGTESSTTLNPVREINFDQIEIIRKRLQQVTDDLIRKKIVKLAPPEEPIRASFSTTVPDRNSLLRQAAQINVGTIGLGVLFPIIDGPDGGIQNLLEYKIGTFPSELVIGELDKPLSLDCKEILKQYDFAEVDSVEDPDNDEEGSNTNGGGQGGSGSGGGNEPEETGDDNTTEEDDELSDYEECATIEMQWLKIILIILRIIKILQQLLDMILAILVPLLEIVLLALMCWLIPPAAEQLRQRITEMVMAIIIMIITRLIAMIFTLLNLDCLCDQTMDTIAQIKQAMSAFSSIMSVFNKDSVSMMMGNFVDQLMDPLDQIAEMYEKKREAWDKMKQEWGNLDINEMWKKTKDQAKTGFINAISTDPNVQKAQQTAMAAYNFMKDDIIGTISNLITAKKAIEGSKPVPEPGAGVDQRLKKYKSVRM